MRAWLVAGVLLSTPAMAHSECLPTDSCVSQEDMAVFLEVLREKQCLQTTRPTFKLAPIHITHDKDGRVYVKDTENYQVSFTWCPYTVEATAKLKVDVAQAVPPTWGFRFRTKVTPSFLPVAALDARDGYAGLDVGVLLEPFFYKDWNLNGYVGVRSFGAGVGLDLTKNLGVYVGYAQPFGASAGPHLGLSFALW